MTKKVSERSDWGEEEMKEGRRGEKKPFPEREVSEQLAEIFVKTGHTVYLD